MGLYQEVILSSNFNKDQGFLNCVYIQGGGKSRFTAVHVENNTINNTSQRRTQVQ